MGRPQRADKQRRETDGPQKSRPSLTQAQKNSTTIRIHSDDHDQGRPNTNGYARQEQHAWEDASLHSLDFRLCHSSNLEDDEMHGTATDDMIPVNFDFVSPQVPHAMSDLGMYDFGSEATASDLLDPEPCAQFISLASHSAADHVEKATAERPGNDGSSSPSSSLLRTSSSPSQQAVEKLSDLNVQIHRQLTTDHGSLDSAGRRTQLSCAVVSMIEGLKTFRELLFDILSTTSRSPLQAAFRDGQNNGTSRPNTAASQNMQQHRRSGSMLSLSDCDAVSLSNSNSDSRPFQEGSHHFGCLDMSTSLLLLSCYANLILLCREVFAAIRRALPISGHQSTLLELSGFRIGSVAVQEDSDLQITILIQVVVRLIDGIGHCLGYPYSSTTERGEASPSDRGISLELLDLVLGPKGRQGQPSHIGQIEALREDIRNLSKIVYKSI
uniref:Transcription factor pydF n=1 Tax=Acremonium sp. TaxID=2046025 RepID=PYDF_ACRSP|nr:RecName: Full=Transcription factor pydF; AltName: Full=Pyrrocidines biosynthesis cluster protein F [Acremonium sp.]QXF14597.1 PydF [Acremonium sp.]